MATLFIKNFPKEVKDQLKIMAIKQDKPMFELVIEILIKATDKDNN